MVTGRGQRSWARMADYSNKAAIWQQAEHITLSEQSNVLCVLCDLPTTGVPSSTRYVYLTHHLTHLRANNGSL
jgi:hypothetical protein